MTAAEELTTCTACSHCRRISEFGAQIFLDCSPQEFAAELSSRYGSYFSTAEYFALYAHPPNYNACVLDDPYHALVFSLRGRTADILNRLIDIDPEALERAAAAIFTALPAVRRVRAEVKFPPERLRRCHRVTQTSEDMVVELPADVDAYHGQIGNTTRKHLRQYNNKLRRECPGFELRRLERDQISLELVEQTVAWTNARVRAKGDVSVYEEDPAKIRPVWQLLHRYGLALCGYVDGELVAAQLLLLVGQDSWIHTVGFDSRFEKQHLGLLMTYYSVLESIERGCRRTHMLFGTPIYKRRLGAEPVVASVVSLYRSPAGKALSVGEVGDMLWRDRQRIYWSARRRTADAARAARRALRRPGQADGDAETPAGGDRTGS